MIKKVISILLACVLVVCVFAGCGENAEETDGIDTSTEDLCYSTTGILGDTVLFTVDGNNVNASLFFYWLGYEISYYDYYSYYYDDVEFDLSEDSESFINDAKEIASQYVLLQAKVQEMGLSMTDEMQEDFDSTIEETKEYYGGEEEYYDELRKMGLTEDDYFLIIKSNYYVELLEDTEFEGRPTYDDLEAYANDNGYMYMKDILFLTTDDDNEPLSDEDIAAKKALAEQCAAEIQMSDDPVAKFNELMDEYSDDDTVSSDTDGYLFASGEILDVIENAVTQLNYNGISGVVEYDGTDEGNYSGYYIILRLDPADDSEMPDYWLNDQINALIQDWLDNAEYTYSNDYNDINVESFYDKYYEYQTAFSEEEENAESEGSSSTSEEYIVSEED